MADPRPENSSPRPENKKKLLSANTRTLIIEAAEKMFTKDGVEGVSMRQIRVAIGSSHTNVVTYHFGSKDALIEAIIMDRHPTLEHRRAQLLATARMQGRANDLAALTHAVWWPYFELTNAEGNHTYAAFLSTIGWNRAKFKQPFLVEAELGELIAAQVPKEARNFFPERLRISFKMIASALEQCDSQYANSPRKSKELFEIAIRMGTAALLTP